MPKKGGVIIYPTDTVYGLDVMNNKRAMERLCRIKDINIKNITYHDLSHAFTVSLNS